ncbi:MAG: hypothetical protein JNJ48_07475 [Phycisphaerae bacterium]|nr:hypothetical protein [Phycisphaerae bacterium]
MLAVLAGWSGSMPLAQPGFDPGDAKKLFPKDGRKPGAPGAPADQPAEAGVWTIVLVAFRGPDADDLARQGLEKVQRLTPLKDAFIEKRSRSTIVAVGRFSDPEAKATQAELNRVRSIEAEGGKPFASAFLCPPERAASLGSRPEYNLLNAREEFGKNAKYTLQVGAYGPANPRAAATPAERAEARKAAEQAAEQLRRDGELAFYYHGPNLSMVTIGVFGDEALERFEPPDLAALRQRFPNSLYNGAGVKEYVGGRPGGTLVLSKLVRIPEADAPAMRNR